jgi:hypothetical protein
MVQKKKLLVGIKSVESNDPHTDVCGQGMSFSVSTEQEYPKFWTLRQRPTNDTAVRICLTR